MMQDDQLSMDVKQSYSSLTETEYKGVEVYQKELLDHLTKFDNACRKNGIKYSLHGGTMLGAVRHNGFIPWDDDVDITMTSSNYQKFKRILPVEMPDYYISEDESPSPRLLLKHYNERPIVWIDFLEYNYISEKKHEQKLKIFFLTFLAGMCRNKYTIRNSSIKKHGLLKIVMLRLVYYFGKLFPMKFKLRMHRHVAREMFQGQRTLIHRSNDQAKSIKYIMPAEYMESYTNLAFEGKEFMVSSHYKDMLVIDYGKDYMTPPPEGMRTGHDDVVRIVCEQMQREYERNHPV